LFQKVFTQGRSLRTGEVEWSARRSARRAFRHADGVAVETIRPERPFALEVIEPSP
jgi:hypothetical protein